MSTQFNEGEYSINSNTNYKQKQLANEIIGRTINDCNRSIETINTVMECLFELNNLLLKNAIWKKNKKDKNMNKK
jgi:hypothetical protein